MHLPVIFWLALAAPPDGPTLREIRSRGKLIVSVKNEGVPQPALHHDPAHFQKRGFEVELARALAARIVGAPDRLDLRLMPRTKRLEAVASGAVDLTISMIAITAERKRQVDFSIPYFVGGLALLVGPGSKVHGISDLHQATLGVVTAHANDPTAEIQRVAAEKNARVTIAKFERIDDAVAALRANRILAIGGQLANLDAERKAHPELHIADERLTRDEFAVAIHKGHDDLRAVVDAVIRDLARRGELERMAAKWGLPKTGD